MTCGFQVVSTGDRRPQGGAFRRRTDSREPNGVCEDYASFHVLAQLARNFDVSIDDAFVIEGTRMLASFGDLGALYFLVDRRGRVRSSGAGY